jgi:hypothetical protein
MKLNVLTLALAATALGVVSANAETVIEKRHDPAVVIEKDRPAGVVGEKKVIKRETAGAGDCLSKTVHKEDETGSKTIHKTNCD